AEAAEAGNAYGQGAARAMRGRLVQDRSGGQVGVGTLTAGVQGFGAGGGCVHAINLRLEE
ncbi:MAG TPA: hypothetical protein PLP53_07615, partial [Plasticicumulans sp.]|nr:hypothetical protein [Plasticicumulans sp.]